MSITSLKIAITTAIVTLVTAAPALAGQLQAI